MRQKEVTLPGGLLAGSGKVARNSNAWALSSNTRVPAFLDAKGRAISCPSRKLISGPPSRRVAAKAPAMKRSCRRVPMTARPP